MRKLAILLCFLVIGVEARADWPTSALDCLTANIYHEARGESLAGQYMVAYVTMNRLRSSSYPNTICEVVKEFKQFSWYHTIKNKYPKDLEAWHKAYSVAIKFIYNQPVSLVDLSEGALFYHNLTVSPPWALTKTYIGRVGNHLFYR